ncbi:hypothetical protein H257_14507 [Aphanomyces astaci]|uniref:Uncharacterized protein n=1 Tax=Aphanomyces astaci TaxID=112090 RepID=W4FTC0_APHAT|nr:hypothetical protein H257_14507 [Aphanomyces astaci]ETV69908.1 hypothetical protein H257_14507 [Aphanomyces astaci]|eukprot:XP_009840646.1 hypothetical protein H257_14507 [Aphanomyces astaci]
MIFGTVNSCIVCCRFATGGALVVRLIPRHHCGSSEVRRELLSKILALQATWNVWPFLQQETRFINGIAQSPRDKKQPPRRMLCNEIPTVAQWHRVLIKTVSDELQRLTCLADQQALRSTTANKIWSKVLTEQIIAAYPTIPQHSDV